jgi:hypothetical protein
MGGAFQSGCDVGGAKVIREGGANVNQTGITVEENCNWDGLLKIRAVTGHEWENFYFGVV